MDVFRFLGNPNLTGIYNAANNARNNAARTFSQSHEAGPRRRERLVQHLQTIADKIIHPKRRNAPADGGLVSAQIVTLDHFIPAFDTEDVDDFTTENLWKTVVENELAKEKQQPANHAKIAENLAKALANGSKTLKPAVDHEKAKTDPKIGSSSVSSDVAREDFVALKRTVGDRVLTLSDFARQRMITLAAEKNLGNVAEQILDDRTVWKHASHKLTEENEITFESTVINEDGTDTDCKVYMYHDVSTGEINGLEIREKWSNSLLGSVSDSGDNSLLIRTDPSWNISPEALQYLPDSKFESSKEDREEFRKGLIDGTFLKKSGGTKVVSGKEARAWYREARDKIKQAHNVQHIDEEDLVAIHMYTRYSDGLKSGCKSGNIEALKKLQPFIRCLASGLNRLGPELTYNGLLYRGAEMRRNEIDAYKGMIGKTITEPAVVSTSFHQNFQWPDSNVLEIITPKKRPEPERETEKPQSASSSKKGKGSVPPIDLAGVAPAGSRGKNVVELSNSPQEGEVTFPFLGKFKITRVVDSNPNYPHGTSYSSLQFPLTTIYKEEV
jgi:hypothetical protein